MEIKGRCHCSNIRFKLHWLPEPTEIAARACGCSFCMKHGGIWTSCPTGSLEVSIVDESLVKRYEFGTKTAQFQICSQCGVVPLVTCDLDGQRYAVVNVNVFENLAPSMLRHAPSSFDGEDASTRLARRKRNWIPQVSFVGAAGIAPASF